MESRVHAEASIRGTNRATQDKNWQGTAAHNDGSAHSLSHVPGIGGVNGVN